MKEEPIAVEELIRNLAGELANVGDVLKNAFADDLLLGNLHVVAVHFNKNMSQTMRDYILGTIARLISGLPPRIRQSFDEECMEHFGAKVPEEVSEEEFDIARWATEELSAIFSLKLASLEVIGERLLRAAELFTMPGKMPFYAFYRSHLVAIANRVAQDLGISVPKDYWDHVIDTWSVPIYIE